MSLIPAFQTLLLTAALLIVVFSPAHGVQSAITEAEGYSCMGEDKSRKQTKQDALVDAKRMASERALSYIKSETKIENFALKTDIVEAYVQAKVKILESRELGWYKDDNSGDCFKVVIKAEVVPDEKALKEIASGKNVDNPDMPLTVNLWTTKKEYKSEERVKIYLKGNKPFYARVIYRDAQGSLLQLLPNPYRKDNYFNGGVIYEIPAGIDKFELKVTPPFGQENIVVYASTAQLGELNLEDLGGVYGVKTKGKDVGVKTRGIKLMRKTDDKKTVASEFFEDKVIVETLK